MQVMAMLDELAEGGRYQEALTLLRSLEEKGIPPSAQYYHKVRPYLNHIHIHRTHGSRKTTSDGRLLLDLPCRVEALMS